MQKEKIDSVKELIGSLEQNMINLRGAMKKGEEEEFNSLKQDSIEITKKIEKSLSDSEAKKK